MSLAHFGHPSHQYHSCGYSALKGKVLVEPYFSQMPGKGMAFLQVLVVSGTWAFLF